MFSTSSNTIYDMLSVCDPDREDRLYFTVTRIISKLLCFRIASRGDSGFYTHYREVVAEVKEAITCPPPGFLPSDAAIVSIVFGVLSKYRPPMIPHRYISAADRARYLVDVLSTYRVDPQKIAIVCSDLYPAVVFRRQLVQDGFYGADITIINTEPIHPYNESLVIAHENLCEAFRGAHAYPPTPAILSDEKYHTFPTISVSDFVNSLRGETYDAVVILSQMHRYDDEDKYFLMLRSLGAVRPGGLVILRDHNIDPKTKPEKSLLLQMQSNAWDSSDEILYKFAGPVSRMVYGDGEHTWAEKINPKAPGPRQLHHRSSKYYRQLAKSAEFPCTILSYNSPQNNHKLRLFDLIIRRD